MQQAAYTHGGNPLLFSGVAKEDSKVRLRYGFL